MTWRLAQSLVTLRNEVNAAWPNRSKVSDGSIGDPAHASSASDHNPNSAGVVTALDITHDPANSLDAHALADRLVANPNPNLKYVISRSRIAHAGSGWKWQTYSGSNPHDKHIHVSVGRGADGRSTAPYDGTESWNVNNKETLEMTPEVQAALDDLKRWVLLVDSKLTFVMKQNDDLKNWELDTNRAAGGLNAKKEDSPKQ